MRGIPLLHREQEMDAVAEELARVQQGEPVVLAFTGAHGMGKTTMLQAAVEAMRGRAVILHARCHEAERVFPFGVVRQLFDSVEESAGHPGTIPIGFADPGGGPERDLHSLYRATRSLAAGASVIIAVDDFHHADPQSAHWFSYIARRLDGLPVSMVLAGDADHPDGTHVVSELCPLPYFRLVDLRPFCRPCVDTMVASQFTEPVDAEFAAACHEVTCGNPLMLVELCRRLKAAGAHAKKTQVDQVAEMGAAAMWETVGVGLRRRQPSAVELIECLAILGVNASLETAAILAGHGEIAVERARELLGEAGLLTGHPASRFAHPQIQAAIVARMESERRHALHSKAASLLARLGAAPADVAAHVMSIGPSGESGNVDVLRKAAREATAKHDWAVAARFLRRALAETTEPGLLRSITADLGAVEVHRDVPSSLRYLRTVMAPPGEAPVGATALLPFASLVLTLNSAAAGQAFANACYSLGATGLSLRDRPVLLRLAAQAILAGDRAEVGLAMRALSMSRPAVPESRGQVVPRPRGAPTDMAAEDLRSALAVAIAAHGGARQRAVAWARRAGEVAKADRDGVPSLATGCVLALAWAGLLEEAAALGDQQVALAQARRSVAELAVARLGVAEVAYRRGDLAASHAAGLAALNDAREVSADGLHMAAAALSAQALIDRGAADEALAQLAGVERPVSAHHLIAAFHLYVRGRCEVACGRFRDGLTLFLDAGQLLSAHGVVNPAAIDWRSRAVLSYARLGLHGEASKLAEQEIALARGWGEPLAIGRALAAASSVYPAAARMPMLREAVALLDGTGALLEQARAHVRLGGVLHRSGADREARVMLHRGLDLASSCGAIKLAAMAKDVLVAAGARPREEAGFRPSALTAGERRVTELVLQGLTNQEVAVKLCLSKRTVDTHLAHIYRKLGIRGRSRLREAVQSLAEHGATALRDAQRQTAQVD
jgi:DNA-binding CsgD family transcriptional regulator